MFGKCLLMALLIGVSWAQETAFSLPENFTIPPELEGKIDESQLKGLQNQTLPVVKKKCEENGGPAAYENAEYVSNYKSKLKKIVADINADATATGGGPPRASTLSDLDTRFLALLGAGFGQTAPRVMVLPFPNEKAFHKFSSCLKALVDPTKLQEEIEAAKPNGQVDEVFKKYCGQTPAFKECFKGMTEAVKPCFTEKERSDLKIVYNVTEQVADFICFKEGDRIALFIAEEGRECFEEKQEQIQNCVNQTLGTDYQMDPSSITAGNLPDLPTISFGEKECRQLSELQTCVVAALETCPAPTTGNIVESLFKFVRKATPCADAPLEAKKSSPGAASGLAASAAALVLAIATTLF